MTQSGKAVAGHLGTPAARNPLASAVPGLRTTSPDDPPGSLLQRITGGNAAGLPGCVELVEFKQAHAFGLRHDHPVGVTTGGLGGIRAAEQKDPSQRFGESRNLNLALTIGGPGSGLSIGRALCGTRAGSASNSLMNSR